MFRKFIIFFIIVASTNAYSMLRRSLATPNASATNLFLSTPFDRTTAANSITTTADSPTQTITNSSGGSAAAASDIIENNMLQLELIRQNSNNNNDIQQVTLPSVPTTSAIFNSFDEAPSTIFYSTNDAQQEEFHIHTNETNMQIANCDQDHAHFKNEFKKNTSILTETLLNSTKAITNATAQVETGLQESHTEGAVAMLRHGLPLIQQSTQNLSAIALATTRIARNGFNLATNAQGRLQATTRLQLERSRTTIPTITNSSTTEINTERTAATANTIPRVEEID